jgi:hypothetical protein
MAHYAPATGVLFRAHKGYKTGKVSDRFFIVEDVALDVGQNNLLVTATDWVGNARSQRLTVSRVNVGSNRITLAGGNRQRGALNTGLASKKYLPQTRIAPSLVQQVHHRQPITHRVSVRCL